MSHGAEFSRARRSGSPTGASGTVAEAGLDEAIGPRTATGGPGSHRWYRPLRHADESAEEAFHRLAHDEQQHRHGRHGEWLVVVDGAGRPHIELRGHELPSLFIRFMRHAYQLRFPGGPLTPQMIAPLPTSPTTFIRARMADLGFPALGLTFDAQGWPSTTTVGHRSIHSLERTEHGFRLTNDLGHMALLESEAAVRDSSSELSVVLRRAEGSRS